MRTRTTSKTAKERASAVTGEKKLPPSVKTHSTEPPKTSEKPASTHQTQHRVGAVKVTGFETIIDSLFTFDPDAAYKRCTEFLQLSSEPSRAEYGMLVNALDEAADVAVLGHQLLANAKVSFARYEMDAKVISAELHEQAVRELMAKYEDKDDKTVTRKPTKDDLEAYINANYFDEVGDQKENLTKAKETCNYLEGLVRALEQRQRDLRQMVASARGV